jgi:hypothetical protein
MVGSVGVDWASEEHALCVVDERGRIVEGRRYRHDESAVGGGGWLREHGGAEEASCLAGPTYANSVR